uniref:Venom peptide 4a n=1 Tax=Eumenes pomiformis TaxID=693051 RepID=SVIPA_EUMPO|nr:RecName: Full=Venom peptide 4a; Short=EpVP4a; Short=VP4a; Flags: Precursor [Eumenes pomiformis]ACZ37396.1 VP4a protein precursor [Eumenes pomiformis]
MRSAILLVIVAIVAILGFLGVNAEPLPSPLAEPNPHAKAAPLSPAVMASLAG